MRIQKLGIELRKIDDVKSLYRDVDLVLQNHKPETVALQTVSHSLNKMMRPDKYVSICGIDECAKVAGIVIPAEHRNIYQAVHCMSWSEMTDDYRQFICALILNDFRTVLNPNP
jgi:hypothetical protein